MYSTYLLRNYQAYQILLALVFSWEGIFSCIIFWYPTSGFIWAKKNLGSLYFTPKDEKELRSQQFQLHAKISKSKSVMKRKGSFLSPSTYLNSFTQSRLEIRELFQIRRNSINFRIELPFISVLLKSHIQASETCCLRHMLQSMKGTISYFSLP